MNGGRAFSSQAEFSLPNTALRAPDATYVSAGRWLAAEYAGCGVPLVVLLDSKRRVFEVRRPGRPVETVDDPETFNCGEPMPGFLLDVRRIFALALGG